MVAKTVDMPGLATMEGVSAVPEQVPDLREELRGLARRILVLRGGRVAGELPAAEATDARLGPMMIGGGS